MERYGDGWGITPYYVRDILTAVGNRADVNTEEMNTDGVYPHLFRHTAASRLAQAGYTNVQIASWLGVEPSTADIYADISPEEMTEMATALDK
jgi:integrase